MRIFLDTSVLVPVFLADHPHHTASLELYTTCTPLTASCAGHSLAEVYSTLTRLPAPHRASPEQAIKCVEAQRPLRRGSNIGRNSLLPLAGASPFCACPSKEIASRFRLISLDGVAYLAAIQAAAAQNIAGGTVYDFLIATCALHSGAVQIYTWNQRHFERFGAEVAMRLTLPSV